MSFTPPPPPPPLAPYGAQPSGYPAQLDVTSPDVARWQPMFNWILAIPHFVVQYFLNIAMQVVALISWFVIVFTGKWPEGLRSWVLKAIRASTRFNAYANLLTDEYPPLSFD
jgi:hypothetical protein